LDREETEPGYIPRAVFLDEAEEGTIGEYVVTTFNRAFPLIRYRTSDLMRLVSKSPCKCGRTHPRIKVLRRLDDIINMGMIRFSLQDMENALARVCRNGTVEQWQICLSRKGYKPLPKLHVCGCNISDATAFTGEIGQVLSGINVLEMGIKNGLVCQPEIYVEDKIENKTTATGKTQRVIYDANW
jgi:phenylacetate-CoA ligase